jgi:homoserine trans-succinylase
MEDLEVNREEGQIKVKEYMKKDIKDIFVSSHIEEFNTLLMEYMMDRSIMEYMINRSIMEY